MDRKLKLLIDTIGSDKFKVNEQIKYYAAVNVGGPAKLFFIAYTTSELIKVIKISRELKIPFLLFGTGSKLMIADAGFPGLIIKNRTGNVHTISVKGKVTRIGIGVDEALIEVDSGVSINKLREFLDSQNLNSEGFNINGSIGGNLFISNFLQTKVKSIKVLDWDCLIEEIDTNELSLRRHIILSAVFRIKAK